MTYFLLKKKVGKENFNKGTACFLGDAVESLGNRALYCWSIAKLRAVCYIRVKEVLPMHTIDNEKFGLFLVQLRREKGMTQKELAEELYVSDKAVSKWERGLSLPDISLLQPMAELLDVTVTELLSGQYIEKDQPLTVHEVEPLLTGALSMTSQEQEVQREHRRTWGKWYFLALGAFAVEVMALWGQLWDELTSLRILAPLLAGIFGAYFIFGAKEKIPAFYDQHRLNFYSDGVFRMNVPGVYFNNRNWPHIVNAIRTWACVTLGCWLPVYEGIKWVLVTLRVPEEWAMFILLLLALLAILGGMFIPVYVVGRKYE